MGSVSIDFAGEVAFVTGAAGGMGRATSLAFARAGADVVMADVDEARGRETEELLVAEGLSGVFVKTDIADPVSVADAVAIATLRGPLTSVVNAAAIENETGSLHETEIDAFDRMQAVNVRGLFLCMKAEIKAMLAADGGAIVNIASTNSYRPQPHQPGYTTSKFGVLGMTRQAAIDYAGCGIRINAICPGAIDTPMLRGAIERRGRDAAEVAARLSLTGAFGRPEDIAEAAMWLCSEGASYTFGHALAVDGGYLAR